MKTLRIIALALCMHIPLIHTNDYDQTLCYQLGALTALQAVGTISLIAYNRYYKKNSTDKIATRVLPALCAAATVISAGLTGGVCNK